MQQQPLIMEFSEHHLISTSYKDYEAKGLNLIKWDKGTDNQSEWGYRTYYKIGAEWIDDKHDKAIVVTPKDSIGKIDFLRMFMTCFSSNIGLESFSKIYDISYEKPSIETKSLKGIVSPLIMLHFLGVVSRIKSLKRGYIQRSENLRKIKGRVKILPNDRLNICIKRYERIFCEYDEYSTDIPENRLIKRALLFVKRMMNNIAKLDGSHRNISTHLARSLSLFDNVSDEVNITEVSQIKRHKLFSEYSEAIRLAKIILKQFDYSISKVSENEEKIVPFVIDMSLLYEHYVYGLLYEAYGKRISYQFKGKIGKPDFLYKSESYKAILDTKYIPRYENACISIEDIRQLCGYGRDLKVLEYLGYNTDTTSETRREDLPVADVPCIIIYPKEGTEQPINPFKNKRVDELEMTAEKGLSRFYKIVIPMPILPYK